MNANGLEQGNAMPCCCARHASKTQPSDASTLRLVQTLLVLGLFTATWLPYWRSMSQGHHQARFAFRVVPGREPHAKVSCEKAAQFPTNRDP